MPIREVWEVENGLQDLNEDVRDMKDGLSGKVDKLNRMAN